MNTKRILFSALLVDYLAFTAWALHAAGWSGVLATMGSPAGLQMCSELALFFGLGASYVWHDAGRRGASRVWAAAVLFTGVAGLLTYLVYRERQESESPVLEPALS